MGVPLGAAMSSPRWKFSPPKICRPPKGEVIRPRRGQRNRPFALHALGGAHGHLGGGCLRQPVSGHVLPALLLAHGVGDPVCPLLQARGALGEDLLLPSRRVLSSTSWTGGSTGWV